MKVYYGQLKVLPEVSKYLHFSILTYVALWYTLKILQSFHRSEGRACIRLEPQIIVKFISEVYFSCLIPSIA